MKLVGLILIIFLVSCDSPLEKIFWINENTKDQNDFLYMAESTSVKEIESDSLKFFLDLNEVLSTRILESSIFSNDTIFPPTPIFKNYGEIYKSDDFKLKIIFRDGRDTLGRDYKFILRTYQNNWKIIDSYELAIWVERDENYCFGSISKNLVIEKYCSDRDLIEKYEINSNGRFIEMED